MTLSEAGSNEVSDFTGIRTVTSLHYQFSPNPDRKNYIDGFSLILRDATILSKMDISRRGAKYLRSCTHAWKHVGDVQFIDDTAQIEQCN